MLSVVVRAREALAAVGPESYSWGPVSGAECLQGAGGEGETAEAFFKWMFSFGNGGAS